MWISVSKNYEASNDGHIRNKNTIIPLKILNGLLEVKGWL